LVESKKEKHAESLFEKERKLHEQMEFFKNNVKKEDAN
jgi:hypothetical protein